MNEIPRHEPFDVDGYRIRAGDRVRIVGVPALTGMAPGSVDESLPVFERLVGSYRRVVGFDAHGFAEIELRFRGGPEAGLHWVWIEPSLLRVPAAARRRRARARGTKGEPRA